MPFRYDVELCEYCKRELIYNGKRKASKVNGLVVCYICAQSYRRTGTFERKYIRMSPGNHSSPKEYFKEYYKEYKDKTAYLKTADVDTVLRIINTEIEDAEAKLECMKKKRSNDS